MAVESGARASNVLSGDLRGRPLAMLLAGACERRTSGTFTFRSTDRTDHLTLQSGAIAVVRTSAPVAPLGPLLYELSGVDLTLLSRAMADADAAGRLLGEILIDAGAIRPDQLSAALAEQTLRKTRSLFDLPDSTVWSFRDDTDELVGAPDEGRPSIATWKAIWRGLRDRFANAHVRKTLEKIDTGVRLRDLVAIEQFDLDAAERAVCTRLSEKAATLADILRDSPLSPERTEMLLYLLALARCIVRVEVQPIGPIDLGIAGIRERARSIASEDPRTVLGVREGQSIEATRAAFFRLARLWHPDRLPPGLAVVRAECELVHARMVEAHRALADAAGPTRQPPSMPSSSPISSLAQTPGSPGALSLWPEGGSIRPPVREAPTASMRDVDVALARNDFAAADALAATLLHGGSNGPSARAVMAWCGCAGGTSSSLGALERALVALDKIVLGDPDCVRALFYRAQLEMRLGLTDPALRDYRKVVRLDPRHEDARRELGLHEPAVRPSLLPGRPSVVSGLANSQSVAAPRGGVLVGEVGSGLRRLEGS